MSELNVNVIKEETPGAGVTVGELIVPTKLDVTGAEVVGLDVGGGSGKVLQVVSTSYNTTEMTSLNSFVDTGLFQQITPSSVNSNIYISVSITAGGKGEARPAFCIKRGSIELNLGSTTDPSDIGLRKAVTTAVHTGNPGGSYCVGFEYLDSPGTVSPITYTLAMMARDATYPSTLNRSFSDDNNAYTYRGVSTITLMEIAE